MDFCYYLQPHSNLLSDRSAAADEGAAVLFGHPLPVSHTHTAQHTLGEISKQLSSTGVGAGELFGHQLPAAETQSTSKTRYEI